MWIYLSNIWIVFIYKGNMKTNDLIKYAIKQEYKRIN